MTAIIIPRKHHTQPQGRVTINAANHAGAKALCAMTFQGSVFDAAAGSLVPYAATPVYGAGATGYGLLATGGYKLQLPANPVYLQKQTVTYYAILQSTGGGNAGYAFQRSMGSSTPSIGLGVHNGSLNGWYLGVNGTTSDINMSTPVVDIGSAATNIPAAMVLTVGEGAARLYVNGRFVWSGSYGGDIDYSRTDFGLMIFGAGLGISSFRGLLYGAGVIDGVMNADAAGDFSANPWQLFRADPIRIYSLPSGPISLAINSILASNITQTGARITLGLTR